MLIGNDFDVFNTLFVEAPFSKYTYRKTILILQIYIYSFKYLSLYPYAYMMMWIVEIRSHHWAIYNAQGISVQEFSIGCWLTWRYILGLFFRLPLLMQGSFFVEAIYYIMGTIARLYTKKTEIKLNLLSVCDSSGKWN